MPLRTIGKNKRLHIRFELGGRTWLRSTGLEDTKQNRNIALLQEAEMRRQIMDGQAASLAIRPKPFNEASMEYLAWKQSEPIAPNTRRNVASSVHVLNLHFGGMLVHQVTKGDILAFITERRSRNAKAGVLKLNGGVLRQIFEFAMAHNWTKTNPALGIKWPKKSEDEEDSFYVLSAEEERTYFAAVKDQDLYDIGRLMINLGCRPDCEILRIRAEHVDFARNELRIPKSKSVAGRRTLPLTAEARNILARRIQAIPHNNRSGRDCGKTAAGEAEEAGTSREIPRTARHGQLLFPDVNYHNVYRAHERVLDEINPCALCGLAKKEHKRKPKGKEAGCVYARKSVLAFRPYDLRHTFASRLAAKGMPLPTLAKLMGHSGISIVQRYYVHLSSNDLHHAMKIYGGTVEQERAVIQ